VSASNVVIVESPSKAKTINKYLGDDYIVLASFGHVRDLPPKDGSVVPDEDFAMKWQLGERAGKPYGDIKKAVKGASAIYLATDPDREGEAISWHIREMLDSDKLLGERKLYRVAFNEITKKAVQNAFDNARDLDENLIDAYLARRALDYLVGFNLSPVLWRKLPGSRSAGRVQSVALRLICERETEIEKFKSDEYWSIEAKLQTPDGAPFTARLTHLSGNKLKKLDIGSETDATNAADRIRNKALTIQNVEKKQQRRNPAAPFITSTLQQEASRKLGFSAQQTMRVAQKLYEGIALDGETVGLITYMRTDGTTLSEDAVTQCRNLIQKDYGKDYLPDAPRLYKSKAKNAQEAHEAVRPTNLSRTPVSLRSNLDDQMLKLYDLIWKRTMASQMENAILDQVAADISDGTDDVVLRATGSTIAFDGFLTLYQESDDEKDDAQLQSENDRRLPPLHQNDNLKTLDVLENQHFTQPPPRYSEASLVRIMEELGIGRPSTYASILQVLRDRNYVILDKKRFIPEDRGRIVTTFLQKFFDRIVDYDFTATLEQQLDAIAAGHTFWKDTLRDFWTQFISKVEETKKLTITEVIDHLNEELGSHFFPPREDKSDPRSCQACDDGQLSLKLGRYGAFIGCSSYPDCKFTRPLVVKDEDGNVTDAADAEAAKLANEPKELGVDPATGRTITLRRGPYGPYVQLDLPPQTEKKSKDKPKRQGLPKGTTPEDVTLEIAVNLLALPRDIGPHPESGKMIQAGIGRFGPYLKHDGKFKSLPKDEDVLTVGMNRAVDILAQESKKRPAKKKPADKETAKKPAKKKAAKKKTTAKKKPAAKKTAKKTAKK